MACKTAAAHEARASIRDKGNKNIHRFAQTYRYIQAVKNTMRLRWSDCMTTCLAVTATRSAGWLTGQQHIMHGCIAEPLDRYETTRNNTPAAATPAKRQAPLRRRCPCPEGHQHRPPLQQRAMAGSHQTHRQSTSYNSTHMPSPNKETAAPAPGGGSRVPGFDSSLPSHPCHPNRKHSGTAPSAE